MTTQQIENSVARNNWLDRGMIGVGAAVLCGLAFITVLHRVNAPQPLNFFMAGGIIALLLYTILAPLYRGR